MSHRRRGLIIRGPLSLAALLAFIGVFCLFGGGWSTLAGIGLLVLGLLVAFVAWAKEQG